MTQGRVLWYSDTIGYGFIQPDDGGDKILVSRTGTEGSELRFLQNNTKVTYDVSQGREGQEAKNVSNS